MNNLIQKNLWWILLYSNQEVVMHPIHGMYTLTGYFDGQVVCHRTVNDQDECEMFSILDIKLVLKAINPFLMKSLSRLPFFHSWIKTKAMEGYWVFPESEFKQIIFKP